MSKRLERSSLPPRNRRGRASKLEPYAAEVLKWYESFSLANIVDMLQEKYELEISKTALAEFINRRKEYAGEVISSTASSKPIAPVNVVGEAKAEVQLPSFKRKTFEHDGSKGGDSDLLK